MIKLTLACAATDRTRPLMDGRVTVPGVDLITTGIGGGYRMDGGSSAAAAGLPGCRTCGAPLPGLSR